jgi:hypothetical protein
VHCTTHTSEITFITYTYSLYYDKCDTNKYEASESKKSQEEDSEQFTKHALQLTNSVGGTQKLNSANTKTCQWSKF